MKKVIVYTKNNCPECEKLKFNLGYLPQEVKDTHNFEYRNIDENDEYNDTLIHLGYSSVPVTFVEGTGAPVVGFNMGILQDAFGM